MTHSSPNRDGRFGNAEAQKPVLLSEDPHQPLRVGTRESIHDEVQILWRSCNSVGAIGFTGRGTTHDRRARPVRILSSERRSRYRLDTDADGRASDGAGLRQQQPGSNENADQTSFASRQARSIVAAVAIGNSQWRRRDDGAVPLLRLLSQLRVGAAEVGRRGILADLDDAAADGAGAGKMLEQRFAVIAADRAGQF
jgi:hypothetical protein